MTRPVIPVANLDTKPFWDGCAEGRLLLQRCTACGTWRHPPSPVCPDCLGTAHDWLASSGRGSVYTFVIVREGRRGWEKMVPYVLAVVALDEGPRILTNLTNVAPEAVTIGMPVAVTFETLDNTIRLPLFEPRPEGARA
jgi:uncharacterized OB-fold protein